jgi:hypothetical protein
VEKVTAALARQFFNCSRRSTSYQSRQPGLTPPLRSRIVANYQRVLSAGSNLAGPHELARRGQHSCERYGGVSRSRALLARAEVEVPQARRAAENRGRRFVHR